MTYAFKVNPFKHQLESWTAHRDDTAWGHLWEQGTGKSKQSIDTACWLWLRGEIDAVVVVAPNGVHRNWVEDEIPEHVPEEVMPSVRALYFQSERSDTKWHKAAVKALLNHKGFAWFTISYEAFMTNAGKRSLIDFFDQRRVFYVLDESHNIKNPEAKRTESILASAKYAAYRRILTGTPIAQGPFDAYTQVKFLDEGFWERHGFGSFTEFRNHFGVWKKGWNPNAVRKKKVNGKWITTMGAEYPILVEYRRLPELKAILREITDRVTKEDAGLDIPAKLYQKRYFQMIPEQQQLYNQLRDEFLVWLQLGGPEKEAAELSPEEVQQLLLDICTSCHGRKEIEVEGFIYPCPDCEGSRDVTEGTTPVIAALALTRLLRLQQIASGYLPTDVEEEPMYMIPGPNRRLDLLCDLIEGNPTKTIVWARFQMDITLIMDELARRGIKAVRYDGLVNDDGRAEAKALFKGVRPITEKGQVVGREPVPAEQQARVFVSNPAVGATGLTLTEAKSVIYYSNSFKLIDRLQSEDRAHRIGQTNSVLYIDLMAEGTIDEKIVAALRSKFNIAGQITGDRMRDWL